MLVGCLLCAHGIYAEDEDVPAIVIDFAEADGGMIKAGFAGNDAPSAVFPSPLKLQPVDQSLWLLECVWNRSLTSNQLCAALESTFIQRATCLETTNLL